MKRALSEATDCERMLLLRYTQLAINAGVARASYARKRESERERERAKQVRVRV